MHHDSKSPSTPFMPSVATRNFLHDNRTHCCVRDGATCKAFVPNTDKQPATQVFDRTFSTVRKAKEWMNRPSL